MYSYKKSILSDLLCGRVFLRYDHNVRSVKAQKSPWHRAKISACFSSSSANGRPEEATSAPNGDVKTRRQSHSWTADDDARLRQADRRGLGIDMTCKTYFPNLDLSRKQVSYRRHQLGLTERKMTWTETDIDLLQKACNEGLTDLEMVAAYFPTRTTNCIVGARIRLQIHRKAIAGRKTDSVSAKS